MESWVQGGHGEEQRQLLQGSRRRRLVRGEAAGLLRAPVPAPVLTGRVDRVVVVVLVGTPDRKNGVVIVFVEQGRVYMAQDPEEYSSTFPAVGPEEGQAHQEFGANHRVDHVRQNAQIARAVGPKLEVP